MFQKVAEKGFEVSEQLVALRKRVDDVDSTHRKKACAWALAVAHKCGQYLGGRAAVETCQSVIESCQLIINAPQLLELQARAYGAPARPEERPS
jgi:hypothetical protein